MRNLRNRYSYKERKEFNNVLSCMRQYILPLLLKKQKGVCALCSKKAKKYDIHHKLYNPMENIDALQALCIPCHKALTDFRPLKARAVK